MSIEYFDIKRGVPTQIHKKNILSCSFIHVIDLYVFPTARLKSLGNPRNRCVLKIVGELTDCGKCNLYDTFPHTFKIDWINNINNRLHM